MSFNFISGYFKRRFTWIMEVYAIELSKNRGFYTNIKFIIYR